MDPQGNDIPVDLLNSAELAGRLERLDAFEGKQYIRVQTVVFTDKSIFEAFFCVLAHEVTDEAHQEAQPQAEHHYSDNHIEYSPGQGFSK